jgi:hypothetical protein
VSPADGETPVAHSALDGAWARSEKVAELEASVTALKAELGALKNEFTEFRQQFD